jgi:hypothetical protein
VDDSNGQFLRKKNKQKTVWQSLFRELLLGKKNEMIKLK